MSVDSILNGVTIWYDSLGNKYGEQVYSNGKLNGTTKSFYKNGQLAEEKEYLNDKIVKEKEYDTDGTLLYLNPIDLKTVGKMKVIIGNGQKSYFTKNKIEDVSVQADGVPILNQITNVIGASIRGVGNYKFKITPNNNAKKVNIILIAKNHIDTALLEVPIDSVEIQVK